MGGDVDCWIRGRPPSLSPLGKPYWRHHHMENSGFLISRILQENESCINKYHLSCPKHLYFSILCVSKGSPTQISAASIWGLQPPPCSQMGTLGHFFGNGLDPPKIKQMPI